VQRRRVQLSARPPRLRWSLRPPAKRRRELRSMRRCVQRARCLRLRRVRLRAERRLVLPDRALRRSVHRRRRRPSELRGLRRALPGQSHLRRGDVHGVQRAPLRRQLRLRRERSEQLRELQQPLRREQRLRERRVHTARRVPSPRSGAPRPLPTGVCDLRRALRRPHERHEPLRRLRHCVRTRRALLHHVRSVVAHRRTPLSNRRVRARPRHRRRGSRGRSSASGERHRGENEDPFHAQVYADARDLVAATRTLEIDDTRRGRASASQGRARRSALARCRRDRDRSRASAWRVVQVRG
jgi:hypothetical protein